MKFMLYNHRVHFICPHNLLHTDHWIETLRELWHMHLNSQTWKSCFHVRPTMLLTPQISVLEKLVVA